ncbi:MAG: hypothetical protein PWP47_398 [Synergistaceae bacterium]|nr:hypothetical protein [Synergistaceae bacterium]
MRETDTEVGFHRQAAGERRKPRDSPGQLSRTTIRPPRGADLGGRVGEKGLLRVL